MLGCQDRHAYAIIRTLTIHGARKDSSQLGLSPRLGSLHRSCPPLLYTVPAMLSSRICPSTSSTLASRSPLAYWSRVEASRYLLRYECKLCIGQEETIVGYVLLHLRHPTVGLRTKSKLDLHERLE